MSRRWGAIAVVAAVVALVATQSASAARVYAGQPAGQSGLQLVLSTGDSGKNVTGLTFHFDVSCPTDFRSVDFGSATVVDHLPQRFRFGRHYLVAKVSGKRVSGTLAGVDSAGDTTEEWMTAKLTGTLSEGKASGRVTVRFADIDTTTFQPVVQCSKTFSWKALRNPGIVYGGRTSQDEPVVLELSPDRKRVSHAHLSWAAPCQTGGFWTERHDEFDLQPFKLSGGGAFNRTYRWNFGGGDGIVERFAGKVTRTKAAGAFRADVTLDGAAPNTCTSGAVSWRAATG